MKRNQTALFALALLFGSQFFTHPAQSMVLAFTKSGGTATAFFYPGFVIGAAGMASATAGNRDVVTLLALAGGIALDEELASKIEITDNDDLSKSLAAMDYEDFSKEVLADLKQIDLLLKGKKYAITMNAKCEKDHQCIELRTPIVDHINKKKVKTKELATAEKQMILELRDLLQKDLDQKQAETQEHLEIRSISPITALIILLQQTAYSFSNVDEDELVAIHHDNI